MNRHFYGAPCGLPLRNLNATSLHGPFADGWTQSWSARVINDELFLCATHTINSHGMSDDAFRSTIDRGYQTYICCHVDPTYDIIALNRPRGSSCEAEELFSECRGDLESCLRCLTDYCTIIEEGGSKRSIAGDLGPTSASKHGLDHYHRRLPSTWTLPFSIRLEVESHNRIHPTTL